MKIEEYRRLKGLPPRVPRLERPTVEDSYAIAVREKGEPGKARKKRTMNKLEMEYAGELEWKLRNRRIISYMFEAITLKIADDTRYTPDFMIVHNDGQIELVEIKGPHCWEDSWIKYKVARGMFSCFCWQWRQKLETGWVEK